MSTTVEEKHASADVAKAMIAPKAVEGFETQLTKYEAWPEANKLNITRARKGSAQYRGKWYILEHVKGEVSVLYTNGQTYGLANGRPEWIVHPSENADSEKNRGLQHVLNVIFKHLKQQYIDMVQLRISCISYGKLMDLATPYKNLDSREAVWDLAIGVESTKEADKVIFEPLPFEQTIDFFKNTVLKDDDGRTIKLHFVTVPLVAEYDTFDECLEFKLDKIKSDLPRSGFPYLTSAIIRPASANLWLADPTKKKKPSCLKRIEARLSSHEKTASGATAGGYTRERLMLKITKPSQSVNEMFSATKMYTLITKNDEDNDA